MDTLNMSSSKHLLSSDPKTELSLFSCVSGITIYLPPNLETLVLFSPPFSQPPHTVSCQILLLLILKHHLTLSLPNSMLLA